MLTRGGWKCLLVGAVGTKVTVPTTLTTLIYTGFLTTESTKNTEMAT